MLKYNKRIILRTRSGRTSTGVRINSMILTRRGSPTGSLLKKTI